MSKHESSRRSLSIGEFAAATQLTPKALRLYDDEQLLRPISTTPSGYRVYGADQVSTGRTIRALRDMNLSLQEIAKLLDSEGLQAELLLRAYLQQADQRYARERRAFQAALALLRSGTPTSALSVTEQVIRERAVLVSSFQARQSNFASSYLAACEAARGRMHVGLNLRLDDLACRLTEPLGDEECALELLIGLAEAGEVRTHAVVRNLPEHRYGAVELVSLESHVITGALDALFDWFDRRGARAVDVPLISSRSDGTWQAVWAFE